MTVLIGCLISSSLMTPMTKAPIVLAQGEERKGHANRKMMTLFDLRIRVCRSAEKNKVINADGLCPLQRSCQ